MEAPRPPTRLRVALISTGGTIEKTYDELEGVLVNDVSNLDIVLAGFCDTLRAGTTEDHRLILTMYGQQLNKVLSERTGIVIEG